MIRFITGTNTIALTLKEKTTLASPTYLFEFINNQSKEKLYCISTDTSAFKERYNKFSIIVKTTTPTPLNGEVKLKIGDEYTYNVYEQESTTNLNPAGLSKVETGYMKFKINQERTIYNGGATTRKVFEG